MLSGTILLTGGSGFLGRAILRRAQKENWDAKFIVYSRDEMKQWELQQRYPNTKCVLGDVARDIDRLIAVMAGVDTVLHLGAVKFIPEAEHNVLETIDVNVTGSRNVALAARAAGIKTVVGISTDKACAPLNTYGMTKALMERMFSEMNRMGKTCFITVRYGNVVGSTGSVIPVFRRQIAEHDKIKVTDPRMTRFWLSVDEAIDLILFAEKAAPACKGYTIIDSCPAMTILDVANAVWMLDCPKVKEPVIEITGARPGEKLHESLFNEQESSRIVKNNRYWLMKPATEVVLNPLTSASSYSSDKPKQWLAPEKMVAYIKDAVEI